MMISMNKIKNNLRKDFLAFEVHDFILQKNDWTNYALGLAYWIVPAVASVIVVDWLSKFRSVAYLNKALGQGVSPELWNTIGIVGMFLFGLSIITSKTNALHKRVTKAAHGVLLVAFDVGLLIFGILLGQFIVLFNDESTRLQAWQAWFLGISIPFLMVLLLFLNTSLWWFATIAYSKTGRSRVMEKCSNWRLDSNPSSPGGNGSPNIALVT